MGPFNANTSSICLQVCYSYDCNTMIQAEVIGNITNGRSISIVAEVNSQMILMTDNKGLRLELCDFWSCLDTIRLQNAAEVLAGSRILGTSLTRSTEGIPALAYVESLPNQQTRIVYRPKYNSSEVIVVDSWQSTLSMSVSPIFLRFDSTGRAIIGYQKFANDTLTFSIMRYNGTLELEQTAEWALTGQIFEISHVPKQTPSDKAYVALAGSSVYQFVYQSYVLSPETSDPSISPNTSEIEAPSEGNSSVPLTPEETIPSPETIPLSPEEAPIYSPSASPGSNSSINATLSPTNIPSSPTPTTVAPVAPPPTLPSNGWINTKMVRIIGPTDPSLSLSGSRFGFQVSMDFWPSYGPVFAVSYYTTTGKMGEVHGYCDLDGCGSDPATWSTREVSNVFDPMASDASSFHHPPALSTAFGQWSKPYVFTDWRMTSLYPDGMFGLATYAMPWSTVARYATTYTLATPASPNSPTPSTPSPSRNYDFLSLIGLIHAIVGAVAIMVAMGLFVFRFHFARARLLPLLGPAPSNIDTSTTHQIGTLNLYYTSLKED